jgi:two-component system, NarL family, sensor kinase
MGDSPNQATPKRGRPDATLRRSVIALVVTALLAFAVVATGTSIVAGHIARSDALDEAVRSANVIGTTVFAPLLPAAIRGDPAAIASLDDAVRIRARDGSLVRVKVWKRDGTIVYSDNASAIGRKFPLHDDVADTIDDQISTADISNLTDPENSTERQNYDRLVEVYTPLTLDDGTRLAFEMYATDARVDTAQTELRSKLVPFALLALLVLLIAQLPVSIWLMRHLGRAQDEHSRLLSSALTASDRERRTLARDLHDGVVQDLAGANYAVDALANTLPPDIEPRSRHLLDMVSDLLHSSVDSLRTLMIDINPPDLTADGLQAAIASLAASLRLKAHVEVEVQTRLEREPSPEVAATLYRCVRECLANIAKHSRASHATVRLEGDAGGVQLRISDNGIGLPAAGIDRGAEGHIGLQLLRDAAADLDGTMKVFSAPNGGTTVEMDLPTDR